MPLIVESYFNPYTKIAKLLFPKNKFEYLEFPISEDASKNENLSDNDLTNNITDDSSFYYTREENPNCRAIKYYFNKIYYIEKNKIVCIHKSARTIKYYDLETGKLISFDKKKEIETIDKTAFLPQLKAQEGELVLFPEEDDEI